MNRVLVFVAIVWLVIPATAQQDRSRTTEQAKVGASTANRESSRATERVQITTSGPHENVSWHAVWKLEKRTGNWSGRDIDAGRAPSPYQVINGKDNLLMTNGANILWTAVTGGSYTAYSNANAFIGVGDSNTAESASQTDLQAATNKLRKAMDATYPQVSTNSVTFRATFGSSDANFAWAEWAVFNASSGGTMLNRKVQSMGTKASGSSWTFTVTLSLS